MDNKSGFLRDAFQKNIRQYTMLFALVAIWVIFSVLLIGRYGFGWRGKRAVQVLYTGSVFLLLGYVGSRFVLEVILGRMP